MTEPARRYAFLIEAIEAPDALLRVLTLFAVQPVSLASVAMVRRLDVCEIRVEADGLEGGRAETLVRRLSSLPSVRSVALGWRGAWPAAA